MRFGRAQEPAKSQTLLNLSSKRSIAFLAIFDPAKSLGWEFLFRFPLKLNAYIQSEPAASGEQNSTVRSASRKRSSIFATKLSPNSTSTSQSHGSIGSLCAGATNLPSTLNTWWNTEKTPYFFFTKNSHSGNFTLARTVS
jgi:hypothetical protein